MSENLKDRLNKIELAKSMNVSVKELEGLKVTADKATTDALLAGNVQVVGIPKKVVSPRELRLGQNITGVAHHTSKPLTAEEMERQLLAGAPKRLVSQHVKLDRALGKPVLSVRPPNAPSILDEVEAPVRIIIHQGQSPGDILMLTAAVRDLHANYPGKFVTDLRTPCPDLWQGNPLVTKLQDNAPGVMHLRAEYGLIHSSNQGSNHFVHGFGHDFTTKLGLPIRAGEFKADLRLSDQEKAWLSQVHEILNKTVPYWVVDAGHKSDFTAKHWSTNNYQHVVDSLPDIWFVQIGADNPQHTHPALTGDNVINLIGKTSQRQLARLVYNSAGVITPVSFPMHLSAALPAHPMYKRKHRPCIVLAGGREPAVWEQYSNHQFLHTCGQLPCNIEGGCWKSRTIPIGDGDSKDTAGLCERPVEDDKGEIMPQCMAMITPETVVNKIRDYLRFYDYSSDNPSEWSVVPYEGFTPAMKEAREKAINKAVKTPAVRQPPVSAAAPAKPVKKRRITTPQRKK